MRRSLAAVGALLLCGHALAAGPHEHGTLKLDVAVEPGRVTLLLDSPLANLIGFERAPRTEAERQRVDAALTALNGAAALFRIDPAAGCVAGAVALNAAAFEGIAPGNDTAPDGHADIGAAYSFKCRKIVPAFIDVGVFAAFSGVQRIDVQLVAGKAPLKRSLSRPAARLSLAPI